MSSSEGSGSGSSEETDSFHDSCDCCYCDKPNCFGDGEMVGCVASEFYDEDLGGEDCECWAHLSCHNERSTKIKADEFICPVHVVDLYFEGIGCWGV